MTRRRTTAKRIDALHHFFLRGGKKSLLLLVLVPSATNVTMTTTIQEKPSSTNDTMPSTTTEPTTAELTVDDRNNSSSSGTTSRSERPLSTSNCVDIVMIDHTDLIQFSRINDSANKEELLDENDEEGYHRQLRTELIHKIEQAFGPTGLGIVAITNIPNLDIERQQLLPLGAKIPNIENLQELVHAESLYSVGWSHGKEMLQPGQPDYCKGSYYANPLTDNLLHEIIKRNNDTNETTNDYYSEQAKKHPEFYAPNIWPSTSLPELRDAFCTLGQTLVRVGILVANVCDAYCSDRFNNPNNNSTSQFCLSKTIQESFNCKGRLLHYFAPNQGGDLNGNGKNSDNDDDNTSTTPVHENNNSNNNEATKEQQLWCAWHNDHVRFLPKFWMTGSW